MPARPRTGGPDVRYSVHPGVAMMQNWVATLEDKTGRSLDEWIRRVRKSGPPTEPQRRDWLKKEHGLGTNPAWWIAEGSVGKGGEDADEKFYLKAAAQWVEQMYAGKRAGLRPVHDALIVLATRLGRDVRICPCKTIVPVYRKRVFAEIKLSTNTRIDFGLALGHYRGKLPSRLVSTGGAKKGGRITHRIPLSSVDEVDAEVGRWLKSAYDLDE